MSARSYMSIGDVLTLLRQEFPDVTISKIRFLESQGLVNPERTPSGYRKFYEHDVERLRWVLRQQREHFLPLKVIKDRLDDESGSAASPSEPARAAAVEMAGDDVPHHDVPRDDTPRDGRSRTGDAGDAEEDAGKTEGAVLVGQRSTERGAGSPLPGMESSIPTSSGRGHDGSLATAATRAGASTVVAAGGSGEDPNGPGTGTVVASAARRSRASDSGDEPSRRAKTPSPSPSPSGAAPAGGDRPPAANGVPESPGAPTKPAASSRRGGTSLSVDELASGCGLEVDRVRELEEFGLLTSTNVAGVESYGEEALAVARLAAQFARFGVEPRHLRLYKNAADREAGFVEQIVLPLVRQRNPDARARAREAADELALLGQELRSALLRSALGTLLEG